MNISEILKKKERVLSFEFFPPKKVENEGVLFETIERLKGYNPDFVSVTYGAGGSTSEKTMEWTKRIKLEYCLEVMMHLTCVAATRDNIKEIVTELRENDIENILALRGDLPGDMPKEDIQKEFTYASELVTYLQSFKGLSIGVAGYPECHGECSSLEKDIENLKIKVDQGADFVITQLFFDNTYYYEYMNLLAQKNINIPVLAGIMPITNIGQVLRFTEMCSVKVPDAVVLSMNGMNAEDMMKYGVEYAVNQCNDLMDNGVKGLHFYTLNKSAAIEQIIDQLGI